MLRDVLIPRALVITPNLPEAAALLDAADRARPRTQMRARPSGCSRSAPRRC